MEGIRFRDGHISYRVVGRKTIHTAPDDSDLQKTGREVKTLETPPAGVRRFQLDRNKDVNHQSGTGIVAEGIEFSNGSCSYRWLTNPASTMNVEQVEDVYNIHAHGGRTQIKWMD